MGNCHVQFKGEGKEVILVEPVARPESSDWRRPPDPTLDIAFNEYIGRKQMSS